MRRRRGQLRARWRKLEKLRWGNWDIRCVKLEELLASKLKALLQRQHSPDFYLIRACGDFFRRSSTSPRREVLTTFLKQNENDEPQPLIARNLLLELPFQTIRGLWSEYLACPKLSIFSSENAETWFKTVVGEIFALVEPRVAYAGATSRAGLTYFPSASRSNIMESARLHRLLRFMYDGLERVIEPYASSLSAGRTAWRGNISMAGTCAGAGAGRLVSSPTSADKVHSVAILD